MQSKKSKHIQRLIILLLIAAAAVSYFFIPAVKDLVNQIVHMFSTGDFAVVEEFVASYGSYAMLVSALLMVFQSLIAPLPAFLITFANASLFGWWQGAILSWSSAMAGAALCFWLAKLLGRDFVEKLTSKTGLAKIDEFFAKYGRQSVLIARLLPFMSFDIVSYAAGLTSMGFWPFLLATGLGQLPATIIYSYVGGMLTGGAKLLVTGLLIVFALSVLAVLLRQIFAARQKARSSEKQP